MRLSANSHLVCESIARETAISSRQKMEEGMDGGDGFRVNGSTSSRLETVAFELYWCSALISTNQLYISSLSWWTRLNICLKSYNLLKIRLKATHLWHQIQLRCEGSHPCQGHRRRHILLRSQHRDRRIDTKTRQTDGPVRSNKRLERITKASTLNYNHHMVYK